MKKLNLLVLPLMAISFLTNCGGGSTPSEDVKFSIQESSVTLKEDNTIMVHLDWTPTNHSIEFSNFTFTLDSGSTTATVTSGTIGDRPLELTITFASALSTNDKGDLKFHYSDKTAKKEGEGKVNDINIKVAGDKPGFSVTASTVKYDEGTHSAMVELNWEPASDSITFSNLDFTYGTKHADEVTAEATTSSPTNIYIKFGDAGLDEDVTGTLSFAYTDTTTGVTGKDEIKNITIDVDEPEPPVTTYHISMATEGTDIEEKELPTDKAYVGTITVTANKKILNGLTSVILQDDSNTDITTHCTYDPEQDNKSASLEIPLEYLTNDIEVTVALTDEPEEKGTVKWVNYDNTPLVDPYELPVGSYAEYKGDTPTRPTTSSYVYQFSGWDKDPTVTPIVGGDNVFKAQFDQVATNQLAANMKLVIPSGNADLTFSFDCTASKKITVDWGDNTVDNNKSHTYSKSGTYNVGIYGEDITTVSAGEKGKDYLSELALKDKITAIPDNAFKSCTSLTKATVPSSVTSLGEYAFAYCTSLSEISNLTNITSISAHAFESCALTVFSVQTKTTEIGEYAFANCTSLETVYTTLAYDTLKTIGAHAFESCKITSIVIPGNVTSIGDYAFSCCDKLAIVQCGSEASLTSIGKGAFYDCSLLSTMEIPDAIISVGADAFTGCNLTYTTEGNCRYLPGKSGNQYLLLVKASNDQITSATIHNSCNVVCGDAFRLCTELTTINIPNNVRSIGDSAFQSCKSLSTATITNSSSLVTIGNSAFYGCSKLTNINIPNGVTSIGNNAFQSCSSLSTATISSSSSLVTIGEYAFYGCSKLTEITIPDKVTLIGNSAFLGCSELSKATISSSSSLETIGDYAFTSCKKLKTIYIPKKVTSIGTVAFQNCSILETVDLTAFVIENPDNIPNLGAVAFIYCEALSALKVANDKMVKIFQEKDGWSTYADKIVAA
ncbi:MAG: leucine-rich repeat domain-containing protein [Bacilli bacterium]|nr:leucine-rich repeat domain-containing protein [Bacilli bacterium]